MRPVAFDRRRDVTPPSASGRTPRFHPCPVGIRSQQVQSSGPRGVSWAPKTKARLEAASRFCCGVVVTDSVYTAAASPSMTMLR